MFDVFLLYELLAALCGSLIMALFMAAGIYCERNGIIKKDSGFGIALIGFIPGILTMFALGNYFEKKRPEESILGQYNRINPSINVTSYNDKTNTANIAINKTEKYYPRYVITEKIDPNDPRIRECQNGKEFLQWRENSEGFGGIIVRIKCDPLPTK